MMKPNSPYVYWHKPRLWKIRMRGPVDQDGRLKPSNFQDSLGVVANSAFSAITAAQELKPDYRVESCNDAGEIDLVVDSGTYCEVTEAMAKLQE